MKTKKILAKRNPNPSERVREGVFIFRITNGVDSTEALIFLTVAYIKHRTVHVN